MKELGLGLLIIGLISLVLPLINPNIRYVFLTWIDQWGPAVAWGITAASRCSGWPCGWASRTGTSGEV